MSQPTAHAPIQAAEFSGPGKHAVVVYAPGWSETVLSVLRAKPAAYEAGWRFHPDRRAHILEIAYTDGPAIQIALIDGIHNPLIAKLAMGAALVLSPFPLYRESPEDADVTLFSPEESLVLPQLPSPLEIG